ncbi:hypothetical protein FNH22_06695 [Fulvivirga sp. M361]|uniref:DUF4097 family beta strand repeat-containing protein n=1 Tax=Fulvivirga sp. M361 TaxID=2594266 RepID=UPI001179F3B8|nr:DUF4097 family beta strand repeat-containing protein [Fulvivirga sp. M361]TRX60727.1 hypothetical protein FNH22_06695 [Fulvivirga sp. M361]
MKNLILLVGFSIMVVSGVTGQDEVHVATRTIEKRLEYAQGDELEIRAEKAVINISTWDKKHISLELKLISKHKKKETARSELDLLKYDVSTVGRKHIIKNFFEASDKFVRVKGNLLTEFTLKVPQGCDIVLTNQYGKLSVTNLNTNMSAFLKFVDCEVTNGTGLLNIESSFGNIYVSGFSGSLKARLERSNLELISFDGIADLDTHYGEVSIEGGLFKNLAVNGIRTKIDFATSRIEAYNYDVKTTFSTLRVPESIGSDLLLDNESQQLAKNFKINNPRIKLHTTYGSINLKQIFSASKK